MRIASLRPAPTISKTQSQKQKTPGMVAKLLPTWEAEIKKIYV
jgi:hypothetical protein